MAAVAQAIGNTFQPVTQEASRLIKLTPPVVAYNFPWLLLFYLLLLIILHTRQAIKEQREAKAVVEVMAREKAIADEKENFVMLTSHYMRTWTTYIRNGVDLISSVATVSTIAPELMTELKTGATALSGKVDDLLKTISDQSLLGELQQLDVSKARRHLYTSPFLIGPLVIVGAIGLFANYLFTNLAKIDISFINQIIQILAYVTEASVLYFVLRSRLRRRTNVQNALKLLAHQRAIDQTRNQFIRDSVVMIGGVLQSFSNSVQNVRSNEQARFIIQGYQNLINLISRFQIALMIEGGKIGENKERFMLRQAIDEALADQRNAADLKNLRFAAGGTDGELLQNHEMVRLVIASLIDNAIKFSTPGGQVNIVYYHQGKDVSVAVTDTGSGMTAEQTNRLFQPFSRGESAYVFEHEGVGFGLYLDRLLMKYLGGDVQVKSKLGEGTTFTITMRSDISTVQTIFIEQTKLERPKVRVSLALVAGTIFMVTGLIAMLYFSSQGNITGLLVNLWPILGIISIFVVGGWLAILFGIIEPDTRRQA